jgi:hypothetical protein
VTLLSERIAIRHYVPAETDVKVLELKTFCLLQHESIIPQDLMSDRFGFIKIQLTLQSQVDKYVMA